MVKNISSFAKIPESGFSLIQISILLTIASLMMVAVLPSSQTTLQANGNSISQMNAMLVALRQYQAVNGQLPCPADPTIATGASNYGVAATNTGSAGNCINGAINAAYVDTSHHIAIGMLPVKTLQLPTTAALDGYSRDITYAVDTQATGCLAAASLPGAITVNDNGILHNTVVALVSHGADGYGAWLPLQGSSGTASRLDSGSIDTSQADNAQVQHGGGLTQNGAGQFASFVNKSATSTFDDMVVYKSNRWNINTLPVTNGMPAITPPANGTYTTGQVLTFTLNYPSAVTVTGTPRLELSALGTGNIGTSNKAYANYASGSGTNTLTFSYTVQASDSALTSGIAITAPVDLNGGTISGSTCFLVPDLSHVLVGGFYLYVADAGNNRIIKLSLNGTYINAFGAGYNGISGTKGSSGAGAGQFNTPESVVLDGSGNMWVADSGNNRIQEINSSTGAWIKTIGSYGQNQGNTNNPGKFYVNTQAPQQLAFDANYSNLWVTDLYNSRIQKYNIASSTWTAYTVAGYPTGLAIDNSANIWITIPGISQIYKCNSSGGSCTACGSAVLASGNTNSDYIAVDSSGYIWATDQNNGRILKYTSCSNNAGSISVPNPEGLFFDPTTGNLWYSNDNNSTVVNYTTNSPSPISGPGASTTPSTFSYNQNIFIGK